MTGSTRATRLSAEPTRRVGARWGAGFALAWLGVWTAQLTPVQLLLPLQVQDVFGTAAWQRSVLEFGVVAGVAALVSVVAYPLTGALSDRTTSRFGRRRPWIAVGSLLFAGAIAALPFQSGIVGVTLGWSVASVGFCALSAGLTALIADRVPVSQRGWVSALVSAPQAVGIIVGVVLVTDVVAGRTAGYLLLAGLLVVCVVPFLATVVDPPLPAAGSAPLTPRAVVDGFWISPRTHPDFGWTLLSRILVNLGNAVGTSLLLYFLLFGLRRATGEDDILGVVVVYAITSVAASLVCGRLSDRWGRRKLFVVASAVAQTVAAGLIVVSPAYPTLFVTAGLSGLGYGAFLAVDQALATQVLPDAHSRGKDLGIMNIASAVPQSLGPMLGAVVVLATGGFAGVFVASALLSLVGALAVAPVRGVR